MILYHGTNIDIQSNIISFDELINGMTFREVTSQYSFHTERAIKLLKKAGTL